MTTESTRWCHRCPPDAESTRIGLRYRALAGDHMCAKCRKLQSEVARQVDDPCDQILAALLGDRPESGSSTKHPLAKPAGPKTVAAIRSALAGKGSGKWAELAGRLLPGELELVNQSITEAGR